MQRPFSVLLVCTGLLLLSSGTAQSGEHGATLAHVAPRPEERVDINHASLDELLKVPNLTRAWAMRIVRFRPYHSKEDLLDKGVVSSVVYDRIKDYVVAHRGKK